MYVFVSEDHMLDWHSCQICYLLEINLLLLLYILTRAVRGSDYSPASAVWGKTSINWKLERQKNEEIMKWKSMSSLISAYTIHCIYSSCFLLCIVSTFYPSQFWRKMLWKLSVYTFHPPIVHVCITFQPSRTHSSWERCDKNILMFENWRERKMKK